MKKYYIQKVSSCIYGAIIESHSLEEAEEIMKDIDLDALSHEETYAELEHESSYELEEDENWAIPYFKQVGESYEEIK